MNELPPRKRSVVASVVLGLTVLVLIGLCIALFVSRSGLKQRLADTDLPEIQDSTPEPGDDPEGTPKPGDDPEGTPKPGDDPEETPEPGQPFVNSVGMLLLPIHAGQFQMGSSETADEIGRRFGLTPEQREGLEDEYPQHNEQIRKPFYLSTREVTQQQYELVMKEPYPWKAPWKDEDFVTEGDDYPATHVTWNQAKEFCRRLTKMDGIEYRLPTEAEWEYACRAGTNTAYSFGDKPAEADQHAWFPIKDENTGELDPPHSVGRKWPNRWGLYDMHGNVQEWCWDKLGPEKEDRVLRGGSIYLDSAFGRSASRTVLPSEDFRSGNGFRVATTFHP